MASTIAGDMPALSEFLLTAGDILNLKMSNAKLVVISSCYTRDEQHGTVTSDGVIALTRGSTSSKQTSPQMLAFEAIPSGARGGLL